MENKASAKDAELPTAQNIDLPLDRYMFTEFEIHDLSSLLLTHTLACMKEHGHADTDLPEPPPLGLSKHNERRYGITDGRLAKRLGYRTTAQSAASVRGEKKMLSADEEFTLTGGSSKPGETGKGGKNKAGKQVPLGGCSGEALKTLGYSPTATPGNPAIVQTLNQQSFAASLRMDSVKQALQDWSACMRKKGYAYAAEPFSASNDRRFATRAVTKTEKDVAVADVQCKKSSRLVETWKAEETRIQRSLIAKHQQELEKAAKQYDATLPLIKKLSGPSA
ncbi:hypothetical protein ABT124_04575 [Streptomyces sp. NPDC001982]|uniref:hypothetical protein n=1 Tax=Streptomyces sp. NPDC001982 TaxID=3154405 RepID=UPI0033265534